MTAPKKTLLLAAALMAAPLSTLACGDDDGPIDTPYAYSVTEAVPDASSDGTDAAADASADGETD